MKVKILYTALISLIAEERWRKIVRSSFRKQRERYGSVKDMTRRETYNLL